MKFNNYNVRIIGENIKIGENVRIGDNSIIYDNVTIEDNATICNNCVIGEPLNDYYKNYDYVNPKTIIGKNTLIRSHSIIYAGSTFGENFSTGHNTIIRENTIFGKNCNVGTLSDIQGFSEFGDYCRLHSNVHIGQKSKIGSFVFIYPYVVFTNDPTPPSNICQGPTVGDYSQIAVGSIILPKVNIGKHCLIAVNSSVTKDVEDYALVGGSPAKKICDVRDIKSRETNGSHYPWVYSFERGLPWENSDYDTWLSSITNS